MSYDCRPYSSIKTALASHDYFDIKESLVLLTHYVFDPTGCFVEDKKLILSDLPLASALNRDMLQRELDHLQSTTQCIYDLSVDQNAPKPHISETTLSRENAVLSLKRVVPPCMWLKKLVQEVWKHHSLPSASSALEWSLDDILRWARLANYPEDEINVLLNCVQADEFLYQLAATKYSVEAVHPKLVFIELHNKCMSLMMEERERRRREMDMYRYRAMHHRPFGNDDFDDEADYHSPRHRYSDYPPEPPQTRHFEKSLRNRKSPHGSRFVRNRFDQPILDSILPHRLPDCSALFHNGGAEAVPMIQDWAPNRRPNSPPTMPPNSRADVLQPSFPHTSHARLTTTIEFDPVTTYNKNGSSEPDFGFRASFGRQSPPFGRNTSDSHISSEETPLLAFGRPSSKSQMRRGSESPPPRDATPSPPKRIHSPPSSSLHHSVQIIDDGEDASAMDLDSEGTAQSKLSDSENRFQSECAANEDGDSDYEMKMVSAQEDTASSSSTDEAGEQRRHVRRIQLRSDCPEAVRDCEFSELLEPLSYLPDPRQLKNLQKYVAERPTNMG